MESQTVQTDQTVQVDYEIVWSSIAMIKLMDISEI